MLSSEESRASRARRIRTAKWVAYSIAGGFVATLISYNYKVPGYRHNGIIENWFTAYGYPVRFILGNINVTIFFISSFLLDIVIWAAIISLVFYGFIRIRKRLAGQSQTF